MKTAIKLNRKQLLSIYEKSSELVKNNLRMQFGESFFTAIPDVKIETNIVTLKPKNKSKIIDWELIFDFTSILRLAIYIYLVCIIFS